MWKLSYFKGNTSKLKHLKTRKKKEKVEKIWSLKKRAKKFPFQKHNKQKWHALTEFSFHLAWVIIFIIEGFFGGK